MLFFSPAVCRVTSCLVRPRGSPVHPHHCVSYIRLTLSSMLTAERRPIASPSFPSPSPVTDNSATEPRQRASLIPLFKKRTNSFTEMQIDICFSFKITYFLITLLINNFPLPLSFFLYYNFISCDCAATFLCLPHCAK